MPECKNCPGPISPDWGTPGGIGFIGERPGKVENRLKRNFVGPSGRELNNYLLRAGWPRIKVFVDNLVGCYAEGDRDPSEEEITNCQRRLLNNIEKSGPGVIVPLGEIPTRFFLGPGARLDMEHGIPHEWDGITILPTWHPARALRDTFYMEHIAVDVRIAVEIMRGTRSSTHIEDEYPKPLYTLVTDSFAPLEDMTIAIDTETDDGEVYYVSYSTRPGAGQVIRADNSLGVATLKDSLSRDGVTTILHNALFDLLVLAQVGIVPRHFEDTMIMAYLLQTMPQGLKALAYRLCGMKMKSFEEVARPHSRLKAMEYLVEAASRKWGKPEPVMEWGKGRSHIRQPQPIERRVQGIINAALQDEELDIWARWGEIDGRVVVEKSLGHFPSVSIRDVPVGEAVEYSARDADATLRVYPILKRMLGREEQDEASC